MKRLLLLILAAASLMTGCVAFLESQEKLKETQSLINVDFKGTIRRDIQYADGLAFDLYLPVDCSKPAANTLFFFIHGGGWASGSKADGDAWSRFFAASGYTAATLDYSLQTGKATPSIDQMIEEIHQCIRKVIAVSAENGVTLSQMVVNGYSAGACLALLYSYREEPELPVRFVITESAPVSFNPSTWEDGVHWYVNFTTGVDGSDKGAAVWLSKMSGKDVTPRMIADGSARPVWEKISPVDQLKAGAPPTLLGYGLTDGVVPREHKDLILGKLKETGTHYDYVPFPNSGHALAYDIDCQKAFLDLVAHYRDLFL
ncbi:MAG: alpha/beta hydrolase [Bacteroidales bacterium]|nr:alpha/beta hydrolase [Bacteroidales bacterium]